LLPEPKDRLLPEKADGKNLMRLSIFSVHKRELQVGTYVNVCSPALPVAPDGYSETAIASYLQESRFNDGSVPTVAIASRNIQITRCPLLLPAKYALVK
jgi:hypothetical protein